MKYQRNPQTNLQIRIIKKKSLRGRKDFQCRYVYQYLNFLYLYFMNLYIGNLSYNVKESDLRNVMEEYGTVASVKLITDRETRRSKGFAFIEMPDDTEANNAIKQLNGAEYVGRSMVVKEALPKN